MLKITLLIFSLLTTGNAHATNCPPDYFFEYLDLWLERPDWIVALVSVVEDTKPVAQWQRHPVLVSVDEVYAGSVDSARIRIRDDLGEREWCPRSGLPTDDIGSRWLVAMEGPNADGTYGGRFTFSRVSVVDDQIFGRIPGFVDHGNTRSLDEFAQFMQSQVPRAESAQWRVSVSPRLPRPSDALSLYLTRQTYNGNPFCAASTNAVLMDGANGVIKVSFRPARSTVPCQELNPTRLAIGRLVAPADADAYRVEVFEEAMDDSAAPFDPDNLIASFDYPIRTDTPQLANAEVPAQDSVQSGIGIIRGWACEANRVTVQFDDLAPFELAYGTRRTDTREVCGDSNNGYGGVFAWGLLGAGQHTMRTYIDDNLVDTVSFEVAGLEQPFVTGLEGTYVLEGFPGPGESVTVRWSEAAQNFVIVETSEQP